jgi:UPF0716 protein FxsA
MRVAVLAIVLAFPLLDLYVTARVARASGVPLWVWLAGSFLAGVLLLRHERSEFRLRTVAALRGDQSLLRGIVDSGRKVLAGVLLILPGIMSDFLALVLLALPLNIGRPFAPQPVAAGRGPHRSGRYDTIDGNYRRID